MFVEMSHTDPANCTEASSRHSNHRLNSSTTDKRECYQFDHSHQSVSRTVVVDSLRRATTDIPLGKGVPQAADPHSVFDQAFLRTSTKPKADRNLPVIRGADLFSGCGGLSLGLSEACQAIGYRFEPILAVDRDISSLEVYMSNFTPKDAYNLDIEELLSGKLGARIEPSEQGLLKKIKNIDIVLAGPPCQGNSNLNNHTRRADDRNRLYERVGRFAEIVEPRHILIENVPTVIHGRDRALDNTIEHLNRLGYAIDAGIVDISELGVPQKRRRHVLVASHGKSISIKDTIKKYRVPNSQTIRWAIEDLEKERTSFFDTPAVISEENMRRIKYLLDHDLYDLPNALRPPCHQNGDHSYRSMYGRMRYDEPAQTITTGFASPGQGRYIHPVRPRTLTPHEAARLQFFPDFFNFSTVKSKKSLAKMIGNAVPMKLSYVFSLEFMS
jgi:DNA (cytosine-5)-methyltransferase 1